MRHFTYFVCLGYFTLCHLILGYFSRVKHKQRHKHTQTHSNKKILQSYLKQNTLKSNTLTPSSLKSNNLTLSSLIHSKPSNLNKSKLKQYKRQCISLFICTHLIATPCAYALDNTPQPLEIAQVISSKPHTTQPTLLHSSELVEQIPTPQLSTSQLIPPQPTSLHSITPPPSTLQLHTPPLAPQPDTPQSLQSIATPFEAIQHSASITPQIDLAQSPQVQQPLLASQATTLQPPPINQPSQLKSLDSNSQDFALQNPRLQDTSPPHSHLQGFALLDFTSQDSTLQDSPHSLYYPQSNTNQLESALLHSASLDSPAQHLQDAHLSYPSLPSLESSLPSQLKSLDSLPITPDTSTRFLSPSITHSPNNIEIINITTPNAKGISNNHYIDFNIKPKGAILNNSLQSITSTHLAGFISSNPHLKDFSASLILNQVTSANPSYLLGMLEVAGDKASVLIANPNGIVCKSCGFSNVANLALSTALIEDKLALNEKWLNNNTINTNATNSINNINTINNKNNANNINNTNTSNNNTANALSNANSTHSQQSHQSLQEQLKHNLSLRVQKGHINIDSLNASNTTTLTLLSKSLKINKALYANNLSILLGSNDISLSDKGALLLWQPLQIANTPNVKNTINDKTSTSPHSSTQSNTAQTNTQESSAKSTQQSTQQSTQEITPQPNSTNEVLALDIAYLGGVFANSIYLIASDEHSLVQNSGTMATLPSNMQGDNGFYIDINGRLSIATKTNQTTQATQVNQATQATKENQANQVNQANQSANQTKQISKALYSHNATQSHISNDSNQSNSNTTNTTNHTTSITNTDNTNHTASIAPTIYTTLHTTQDSTNNANTKSTISTTNTANASNTTPYNTTDTTPYTTINTTDTTNITDTTHTTSSTTASLYASGTLNIFAKSITNTSSTIYARDALSMRVDTLENTQGSIYALNTLSIYANTINNIGVASTKTHLQSKQYITQGNLKQVGDKHFWRSVYVDELDSFSPSIIASSGDTYILAHTLSNHNSYISASNILEIQAKNSSNTQTQAYQKVIDNGVEVRNYQYTYWKNYAGVKGIVCAALTFGICNIRELRTATAQGVFTYAPPRSISKIELDFPTLESQLEPNIARLNAGIANEYAKYIHSTRLSTATNESNTINSTNNANYPNHSFNPNHQNSANNANDINQLGSIDTINSTNTINNTSNIGNTNNTNTTSYPNTTNTPNATNEINELANYSNTSFSTSVFDSGRYDDRESFVRSSYFYHQFASRDSSQAKIFLANLDLESKAIFYNSSAFLSNALDTKALSDSQANHLKSLLLHQHYHTNQYGYNPSNDMYSHIISSVSSNVPNNVLNNTHNNTYDIYSNALNNTYNDIYDNIYNNTRNNTFNETHNRTPNNTFNSAFNDIQNSTLNGAHNSTHNSALNGAHNSTNNLTHSLKYSNSISPALSPFASSIGFSGDFISLHSHTFSNDSTLQGNGISLHTSEALAHLGNIKAKDIVLQSDGTLYIGGGDIQASDKAYLQAKHISIDSLITTTKGYTPTTQTILAPARYAISTNASSSLYPFALSSSVNHTSANYYPNQASYLNHTSQTGHTSQINHSNYPNYASHSNHTNYPSYPNYTNQLGTSLIPLHSIDSITATSKLKAGSLFLHATDSTSISSADLSADDSISISSSTLRLSTQALHSTYKDSYQTRKSTTHLGTTLSANSISLSAKDSLNLANASLKANESISLHSKGNISLDSTTDTHYATSTHHSTKEHFFYSKDTTTTTTTQSEVQRGSSLKASTISLNAQDSILSNGTNYHASNALSLNATNNYIESALSHSTSKDATTSTSDNVLGFIPINTKDTHTFAKDTTHTNSTLKASSININAKNTTLLGVDIRSQDEASISTDSFSLANVQDSHYLSTSSKSKRVFGLKNSEQKDTLSKSLAHKSNLTSKNLTLHSDNDINIIASDITISNDASLLSNGNINIHNAYSTTTTTHYEKQTDFSQAITQGLKAALTGGISLLKDTKCKGGKCSLHTTIADYKEDTSSTYAKEVISSNLNIGNNLVISNASSPTSSNSLSSDNTATSNSKASNISLASENTIPSNSSSAPNISILGSNLQANNISLDSANDIVIASAKNSYSTSQSHTQGSISTTLSVGNAYVDAGYAGYGVYQASTALAKASKDYEHIKSLHKQGKASSAALEDAKLNVALATANLTTSMINLTNATASAATAATTGYGTGMYVSAGLSLAGSKQSTDSASTIHTASFLSSNNDISLNATNSITQKGSHLLADNSISYKANNDITLQSSEDTHSSKHSYKDFSTSIEYGTNGFGMQASYSQENSKANSISQNNSTSYAKHITLNTDKSLNIISSNVESNTLEANANSLRIESKYSTQYAKGNGVSTSLGYGSTTSNASTTPQSPLNRLAKNAKSLNLSLGISSSNTDKEWIQTQASLLSQGSAIINIRGNTHLAGGILSSRQEKLSLNTHSLTHSHLSSKDYNDSKALSLSLSASDTELNLHNQGHKKEGIAYATLGYGHINIHTPNIANTPSATNNIDATNTMNTINSTNTPNTINTKNVANTIDSLSISTIENISTSTLDILNTTNTPSTLSNNNQAISSANMPNSTNSTINLADKANTPNSLDTASTPTPPKSLSGLNRDLSRSTTITKDTQTNALDSSLSIDNRIFSRNGRERIASDIKNFKKNILVSGYGATNTLYNAISTPFQALSNKDISLKDTPTLWKLKQSQQSTALTRSQDDFAKDTLDNLSGGKDTLDIQYALALGISSTEKPSKIYYNPNDEALGFHSTSQATYNQNYLNAASGIITDTNATIFTDAHERAHTYTHSEALANIAGKEAIKAWNIANLIHTSINTNRANTNSSKNLGLSSTNISSNTAHKDISKGASNITPIWQATSQNALDDNNFGDLDLVEHLTPRFYLTPKSWFATQSEQSKSTLQSSTYNASLIDSVDRDNLLDIIWDTGNVLYDIGSLSYYTFKGNKEAQQNALIDLVVDTATFIIPFVPAGSTKAIRNANDTINNVKNTKKSISKTTSETNQNHTLGQNGVKTNGSITISKPNSKYRVDVENPAPGKRAGQIHTEVDRVKYLYNPQINQFIHHKTKEIAPPKVQKLLKNPNMQKDIQKALKYLGEQI